MNKSVNNLYKSNQSLIPSSQWIDDNIVEQKKSNSDWDSNSFMLTHLKRTRDCEHLPLVGTECQFRLLSKVLSHLLFYFLDLNT